MKIALDFGRRYLYIQTIENINKEYFMSREIQEVPVIFRMYKGELCAYFPTVQWSDRGEIACYAHVGQHSGASTAWLSMGRRATEEEYKDLLAELKRIYEDCDPEDNPVKLVVYKRAVGKANTRNMSY